MVVIDDVVEEGAVVVDPILAVTIEGGARTSGREVEIAVVWRGFTAIARRDTNRLEGELRVRLAHAGEELIDEDADATNRLVGMAGVHVDHADSKGTAGVHRDSISSPCSTEHSGGGERERLLAHG